MGSLIVLNIYFPTHATAFLSLLEPHSRGGDKLLGISVRLSPKRDCGPKKGQGDPHQLREFESPRVHTRVNSWGLFHVHKLTRGKRESMS